MKKLALTFICTAILLVTAACGSAQTAAPAEQAVPTFTQPAPTSTDLPSATPTPEIAEPPVPHGLNKINANKMVLEDGKWVTKNKNDEVTATWNSETNEWTYNMEKITIQQIIVGYERNSSAYTEVLNRPLPPDDPSTHFINPDTGEPMGYGSWRNGTVGYIHYTLGRIELPIEFVSVRIRGAAEVYGMPVMLLSVPKGPDKELILAIPISPKLALVGVGIANEDLDNSFQLIGSAKEIPNEDILSFLNNQKFGQQILIFLAQEYPLNFPPLDQETMKQTNKASRDILAFLNGNEQIFPKIIWRNDQQENVFLQLFVPQSTTGEIQIK